MHRLDYTTQEYFDRKGECWLGDVFTQTASTCVRYLTLSNFAEEQEEDKYLDDQPLFDQNPFFHYAAKRWSDHVRCSSASVVTDLVLKLLEMPGNLENAFNGMCPSAVWAFWRAYDTCTQCTTTTVKFLHVAAMLGLEHIAAVLLASGALADTRDPYDYTPLLLASEMGYEAVVEILLSRDDVDAEAQLGSPWMHTALTLAAYSGHDAVVRVLLRHGANKSSYNTALNRAVNQRHCAVVETLLEAGSLIRYSTLKAAIAQPYVLEGPRLNIAESDYDVAETRQILELLKKHGANFDHGLELFVVAIAQRTSYGWLRDEGFGTEFFKDGKPQGELLHLIKHAGGLVMYGEEIFDESRVSRCESYRTISYCYHPPRP